MVIYISQGLQITFFKCGIVHYTLFPESKINILHLKFIKTTIPFVLRRTKTNVLFKKGIFLRTLRAVQKGKAKSFTLTLMKINILITFWSYELIQSSFPKQREKWQDTLIDWFNKQVKCTTCTGSDHNMCTYFTALDGLVLAIKKNKWIEQSANWWTIYLMRIPWGWGI